MKTVQIVIDLDLQAKTLLMNLLCGPFQYLTLRVLVDVSLTGNRIDKQMDNEIHHWIISVLGLKRLQFLEIVTLSGNFTFDNFFLVVKL